ncbi:MAG: hypothetical protein V2I33_19195, partial [Kangiellaceae bacterium]|nr:hypothetical protein [Kangiellaceae bacterium]
LVTKSRSQSRNLKENSKRVRKIPRKSVFFFVNSGKTTGKVACVMVDCPHVIVEFEVEHLKGILL